MRWKADLAHATVLTANLLPASAHPNERRPRRCPSGDPQCTLHRLNRLTAGDCAYGVSNQQHSRYRGTPSEHARDFARADARADQIGRNL